MTQSTIYRRHEARMVRSYRLREDPRPPLVRVLSLLPGLHIVFPRYEPDSHESPIHLGEYTYSEETKFSTDATTTKTLLTTPAWQSALQALGTTAASAGIAHSVFGVRQSLPINPFQTAQPHVPRSILMLQNLHFFKNTWPRTPLVTSVPLFMSSTGTLFATRVYLEELEQLEANHFVTAAAAGVASGLVFLWSGTKKSSISMSRHLGYHMLGATVYFGSYDYLKVDNNWSIAVAGAVAGSLQAAVTTRLPMACLRAAPTHAFLWWSFETLRGYGCSRSSKVH